MVQRPPNLVWAAHPDCKYRMLPRCKSWSMGCRRCMHEPGGRGEAATDNVRNSGPKRGPRRARGDDRTPPQPAAATTALVVWGEAPTPTGGPPPGEATTAVLAERVSPERHAASQDPPRRSARLVSHNLATKTWGGGIASLHRSGGLTSAMLPQGRDATSFSKMPPGGEHLPIARKGRDANKTGHPASRNNMTERPRAAIHHDKSGCEGDTIREICVTQTKLMNGAKQNCEHSTSPPEPAVLVLSACPSPVAPWECERNMIFHA